MWYGEGDPPAVGSPERGEGQGVRDAFAALAKEDQESLLILLRSVETPRRRPSEQPSSPHGASDR